MTFFWQNPVFRSKLTERSRADYEEQVKGPGKFEGEAPYVPYFYDVSLHGFADDEESWPEGGGWVGIFEVDEEALRMFPELKGQKKVAIDETSDGLVGELSLRGARAVMKDMAKAYEDYD